MIVEDSPVGLGSFASGGVAVATKGAALEEPAADFPHIREPSTSESVIELFSRRPNCSRLLIDCCIHCQQTFQAAIGISALSRQRADTSCATTCIAVASRSEIALQCVLLTISGPLSSSLGIAESDQRSAPSEKQDKTSCVRFWQTLCGKQSA